MIKSVLITGANSGIGKDCARQMALLPETEKIYLGCRNEERAKAAKLSLEKTTGKNIFEIVLMDVSNLDSVRAAINTLTEPIDALVMNAGGMGGKTPGKITSDGVTQLFATNVLGHVVLLEEMIKANKLTQVAIFAGSEAARGIPLMGIARPKLKTTSVDEIAAVIDGSAYGSKFNTMKVYGMVKYIAALWMSAIARKNPSLRIVTVSPGGTLGTEVMSDLPQIMQFMFKYIAPTLMPLMGFMHKLEEGTNRFVDVVTNDKYKSGVFYASKSNITGAIGDQGNIFKDFHNEAYQDNAYEAIHRFIS